MAGVTFTIARNNLVIGQGISTGTDRAVCFTELEPGNYQVAQVLPATLEMTTVSNVTIDAVEGQQVELRFGSRIRTEEVSQLPPDEPAASEPTAVPAAPEPVDDSGRSPRLGLAALSGLIVLLLAVVLLGGIAVMLIRQQRTG